MKKNKKFEPTSEKPESTLARLTKEAEYLLARMDDLHNQEVILSTQIDALAEQTQKSRELYHKLCTSNRRSRRLLETQLTNVREVMEEATRSTNKDLCNQVPVSAGCSRSY